jgi:hypothetical protein
MIHGLGPPSETQKKNCAGGAQIALRKGGSLGLAAALARQGLVAGKMHLCRFDLVEKNSIFALRHRRNNFLFTPLAPDIYRK